MSGSLATVVKSDRHRTPGRSDI